MPLSDNLKVKVQPASGDTYVKNLVTVEDVAASGAGTITLVDDAGLYGWQVQGARNGNFTGGATYEGGAITVAVRFKANSRSADFSQYFAVGTSTSSFYGAQITNNGSSTGTLRARESIAGGGFTTIGSPTYTTGGYITVVMRLRDNGYNGGTLDIFLRQVSRSNNNPDFTTSATAAVRTGTVDDLMLGAASQNLTFVDIAVWTRDLTDAEAAAVADDIRGQLTDGVTITGIVGNASAAGATATINQETVISGVVGNAAANGSTASISNTADVTINCTVGNVVANGSTATISLNITISCTVGNAAANGSTASITNTTSFTTDIIINNTGTALTSQAVHWTWLPLGRIGSLSAITPQDGTGTTNGSGRLVVTGLSQGAGILLVAVRNTDATDDYVYYEAGTVS